MKNTNFNKSLIAPVFISGLLLTTNVLADPQQGSYDHSQGYGMMGGYGHGYGMGYGMMGGYGMMSGYGSERNLNLTKEQRSMINKIQRELRRKHWNLMGKMQDEEELMNEQNGAESSDDAALSKSFRKISDLRQQMFDLSVASRRQIDAVLTKEQREKRH
jgi:Spy/CpxP family protein refolding chaperone